MRASRNDGGDENVPATLSLLESGNLIASKNVGLSGEYANYELLLGQEQISRITNHFQLRTKVTISEPFGNPISSITLLGADPLPARWKIELVGEVKAGRLLDCSFADKTWTLDSIKFAGDVWLGTENVPVGVVIAALSAGEKNSAWMLEFAARNRVLACYLPVASWNKTGLNKMILSEADDDFAWPPAATVFPI